MAKRISKDQYYMNITREVATRATCYRAHHGVIIVKDDQIISTGYNGAPRKTKDCYERENCLRQTLKIPSGQQYELCRSVHGEQNAIINVSRSGTSLLGARMFMYSEKIDESGKATVLNAYPCFICKKMVVNSGIDEMVCYQTDGTLKTYKVSDWVEDWQKNDLIDDNEQYGAKIKINQNNNF